jgi:outer membrane protein assembly factor BamB
MTIRAGEMHWPLRASIVWLAFIACVPAAEPPKLAGESPRTAQRFMEAVGLEQQQRWADAVGIYFNLLESAGDDLVPDDGDANHLLATRGLVNRRIAARPELLAPYRARVEGRAKRLLDQGTTTRDAAILARLVDEYFCSRSAESALQVLGDMACERGEFDAARRHWSRLIPAESPGQLRYPDPSGSPASAAAKTILARLLAGERAEAVADLLAFRRTYPDATGRLAGREGKFTDILQSQLDAAETVRVPKAPAAMTVATTFAGDVGRNGVFAAALPHFAQQSRYDPTPLPGAAHQPVGSPAGRGSSTAFHPVIAFGQVFVADARRVSSYELATGRVTGRFDLFAGDDVPGWAAAELTSNAGGEFTLTVAGDRIYARLGPPYMRPARGESSSALVGLQWRPEHAAPDERLAKLWALPAAPPGSDAAAAWEGAPLVAEGRLYAAITRIDGARAVTAIACYRETDPTLGPLWQRDVYEAVAETADRMRPNLLTLAGPTLVYGSHAGVIVGLEAATGRRAWTSRYMSGERPSGRDSAPAAYFGERLYLAPADSDRVYCLDGATGARVWASDPLPVMHLLGAAGGRVVCTLGGLHAGLCALDAATGRRLPDWGYCVAGAEALAPFGRGLLCSDRLYLPTRAAGVLQVRWDGTVPYPSTALAGLPGGNLVFGEGYLVDATADRLHVLVGRPTPGGMEVRRAEAPIAHREGK